MKVKEISERINEINTIKYNVTSSDIHDIIRSSNISDIDIMSGEIQLYRDFIEHVRRTSGKHSQRAKLILEGLK